MESAGTKLLGIISIVRNDPQSLRETLQHFHNVESDWVEWLLIDGGSTDGTIDLIKKKLDKFSRWVSENDRGIADAFNKGLRLSQGEVLALLNAGDWYEHDTLATIKSAFLAHKDIDVFCGAIRFWEGGKPTIVCCSDPARLDEETSVYHPTVFIRKSAYEKYGLYDESYRYAMDYELLLRFKRRGAKFMVLDKVLANMPLDGVSYKNWYAGLLEVRRARSAYFSRYNVAYHHLRAVAMNIAARFLKKIGLGAVYQSYWQLRNSWRESGRGE